MEGFGNYKPSARDRESGRGQIIPHSELYIIRKDIPGYFTPEFWGQLAMWDMWRTFGFPWSGGYADQPAIYLDIVYTLESAYRKHTSGSKR